MSNARSSSTASSDGDRTSRRRAPACSSSLRTAHRVLSQFGKNLTSATPGSAQKTYLIVPDIQAVRDALVGGGIDVGEIFHLGPNGPVSGPDPERGTYRSRASFSDPDGNSWLLQEITTRLPGRIDTGMTAFGSASDLASAMRRAEAAHGVHEKPLGRRDENWSDWYAEYMAAEHNSAQEAPQAFAKAIVDVDQLLILGRQRGLYIQALSEGGEYCHKRKAWRRI